MQVIAIGKHQTNKGVIGIVVGIIAASSDDVAIFFKDVAFDASGDFRLTADVDEGGQVVNHIHIKVVVRLHVGEAGAGLIVVMIQEMKVR